MADVTINLLPLKAVPVGTDLVPIWDSAGNITAYVTVASLQGNNITGANNQVVYRNSLGAYVTSAKLQFNGQTLTVEGQATSTHKGFIYRDGAGAETFSIQDNGLVNMGSFTLTGLGTFAACTAARPSAVIPLGATPPTSPAAGHLWHTSAGLFFRFGATSINLTSVNSLPNAQLAAMAANTIKVNATGASTTPTDLALGANSFPARIGSANMTSFVVAASSVVGRNGSGDLTNLPVQSCVVGADTLVAGTRTIFDARITTSSYAVTGVSNTGAFTSPLRYTAAAGQMTFTSGSVTDTGTFSYLIVF